MSSPAVGLLEGAAAVRDAGATTLEDFVDDVIVVVLLVARGGYAGRMGETVGRDPAAAPEIDERSRLGEMLHAGARGAVGAMAMTGMRVLTTEFGLLEQTPPQAVARQRARGARALLRRAPRKQRRGLIEAAHWAFGAGGGAAFGALPAAIRRRPWAGPVYGLVVWLGFEMGIAPVLGLRQAKRVRPVDRLALAADHLLYGLVLSGTSRRAR